MGSFLKAVKLGYQRYFDFNGRSTRPEYWWWTLFFWGVVGVLGNVVDNAPSNVAGVFQILSGIFFISAIIPSLAVTVRRLHDTNRSGIWIFLGVVPVVGLLLLVFMCFDTIAGSNEWGAEPTNEQHEAARRIAEERNKPPTV